MDLEDIVYTTGYNSTYQEYVVCFYINDTSSTVAIDKNILKLDSQFRWKVFDTADGHVSGEEMDHLNSVIYKKNITVHSFAYENLHPCRPSEDIVAPVLEHLCLRDAIVRGKNKFVGVVEVFADREVGRKIELVSEIVRTADLVELLKTIRAAPDDDNDYDWDNLQSIF